MTSFNIMKYQEFPFANGRLVAFGSSKHSVCVEIRIGENAGRSGFISIKNFLYMLNNPDANFDVEHLPMHDIMRKLPNGEEVRMTMLETFWIAPYKPCRF